MSLEPLRLGSGRKAAVVICGAANGLLAISMFMLVFGLLLLIDLASDAEIAIAAGAVTAVVSCVGGQLFVRLALGRRRTGGSVARFTRYQLGSAGIGAATSLAFFPIAMTREPGGLPSAPVWWFGCLTGAAITMAVSVLCFLPSRRRPGAPRARQGLVVVPATVIEHWRAHSRIHAPGLSVVGYPGPDGRYRYVRHLYRQSVTERGIVGEAHVDAANPSRVEEFRVPPFRSSLAMRDLVAAAREEAQRRQPPQGR